MNLPGFYLRRALSLAAMLLTAAVPLRAAVTMPSVFSDHMVLQREQPIPVWGWGTPGETVTVTLADSRETTAVGADGTWRVTLPDRAAGGPFEMTVTGSTTLTFSDVLIGEVWICSGQSNMEWHVSRSLNPEEEIAAADFPRMRLYHPPRSAAPVPQRDLDANWKVCSPETIGTFSAVGYFFGRDLHQALDVPVGMINSSWSGTLIEPWIPPAGFASVPELDALQRKVLLASPWSAEYKQRLGEHIAALDSWVAGARAGLASDTLQPPSPAFPAELQPLNGRSAPTALYNGMIHALVPYGIRGAIWYQGESNRRDGLRYEQKMRALIQGWRSLWGQGDFPFYYVQLAPLAYKSGSPQLLPRIWEAQTRVLSLPNTGMAVINDIGVLTNIHPPNKQEVGRRLALLAKAGTYGYDELICCGPSPRTFEVQDNRLVITFDHAGEGLATRDGAAPDWFELVGETGDYVKAEAQIETPDRVSLTAAAVERPIGVRFAWHETAEPNLVNSAGLPAGAFRLGRTPIRNDLEARIPLAKGYYPVYRLEIPSGPNYNTKAPAYTIDNAASVAAPFDRVAYCLELKPATGDPQYVFVSMDAFTSNAAELGVPVVEAKVLFQQRVANLAVASNVPGVPTGEALGDGHIEFWPSNYGAVNDKQVPGASDSVYDIGDGGAKLAPGYGSMQVHSLAAKTTLFAFNRWGSGEPCELGIGNSPSGNPDWTFRRNANDYEVRRLTVLVRPED